MTVAHRDRGDLGYLFAGFASLLLVGFLDNARGPIIPVLLQTLGIPYATAGLFLTVGNIVAVIATFLLAHALRRWGERRVAIGACWFSLLPGALSPFVDSQISLLLLGVLLGAAVAILGSLCSILTVKGSPPQSTSRYLSFQQVMYGLGSMAAPLAFAFSVRSGLPWWSILLGASLLLFALGVSLIFALSEAGPAVASPRDEHGRLDRQAFTLVAMFACYVAGEVLASMWMSSLLVEQQGLSPASAASAQMYFFIILALSRFCCFLWVRPRYEMRVIIGCLSCGIVMSVLGQQGQTWALPAIGVLGPVFPLCMARLSHRFPTRWRQIMIWIYGGMQLTLALVHLSVGRVADFVGMKTAFLMSPAFLIACLVLLLRMPAFRGPAATVEV